MFLLLSALLFEKFHLDRMHIPCVSFICYGNNPLCVLFTLLVLLPCRHRFVFFPIFVLFYFSLTASATSSFHHHVSSACIGLLTIHMWLVLFPRLYFSSVASVHLHHEHLTRNILLFSLKHLLPYIECVPDGILPTAMFLDDVTVM